MALHSNSEGNSTDRCSLVTPPKNETLYWIFPKGDNRNYAWYSLQMYWLLYSSLKVSHMYFANVLIRDGLCIHVRISDKIFDPRLRQQSTHNNAFCCNVPSRFRLGQGRGNKTIKELPSIENKIKQNLYQRPRHCALCVLFVFSCVP